MLNVFPVIWSGAASNIWYTAILRPLWVDLITRSHSEFDPPQLLRRVWNWRQTLGKKGGLCIGSWKVWSFRQRQTMRASDLCDWSEAGEYVEPLQISDTATERSLSLPMNIHVRGFSVLWWIIPGHVQSCFLWRFYFGDFVKFTRISGHWVWY